MSDGDFETFLDTFSKRAEEVDLEHVGNVSESFSDLDDQSDERIFADIHRWCGNYAEVLIGLLTSNHPGILRRAWKAGQGRLDTRLNKLKRQGDLVDGYLMLALPDPMDLDDGRLRQMRAEIEFNTSVCRKVAVAPRLVDEKRVWDCERIGVLPPPLSEKSIESVGGMGLEEDSDSQFDEVTLYEALSEHTAPEVKRHIKKAFRED